MARGNQFFHVGSVSLLVWTTAVVSAGSLQPVKLSSVWCKSRCSHGCGGPAHERRHVSGAVLVGRRPGCLTTPWLDWDICMQCWTVFMHLHSVWFVRLRVLGCCLECVVVRGQVVQGVVLTVWMSGLVNGACGRLARLRACSVVSHIAVAHTSLTGPVNMCPLAAT